MISWLSGWLKEVIIVVMLAAFVDLLLPNNAFQRYAKTVLSLFILLTLLTPLIELFRKAEWDSGKLLASVEQLSEPKTAAVAGMRSLQAIMRDAERWQEEDRRKAERLLETHLASELRARLPKDAGVGITGVRLTIEKDNNGEPRIEHMQVILHDIDDANRIRGSESRPVRSQAMEPVRPVHIEIRLGEDQRKSNEAALTEEQKAAKQAVYELLKQEWMLNRDQVTLVYESELEKER